MLELVSYEKKHGSQFLHLMQDKTTMHHVGGPKTADRSQHLLDQILSKQTPNAWAVNYQDEYIGHAALVNIDDNTAEVLVYIDSNFWGKGLGAKACEVLILRARELGFKNIQASVDTENHACIEMLKKVGFSKFERLKDEEGFYYLFKY